MRNSSKGPVLCNVGLVDDQASFHSQFQEYLRGLVGFGQVRIWNSVEDYWNDEGRQKIHILFINASLPQMDGVGLAAKVNRTIPDIRVIMLADPIVEENIVGAIKNGAVGYIQKSEFSKAVGSVKVLTNSSAIDLPTIAVRLMVGLNFQPDSDLTNRERQTLSELVSGASIPQTARSLGISENTARVYVKNIYKKLEVTNRVALIKRAIERGMA